jgi:hypothetical protein
MTGRTVNTERKYVMNTSISTKLAALALALMANSVIMGGVAYAFNARLEQPTAVTSIATLVTVSSSVSV